MISLVSSLRSERVSVRENPLFKMDLHVSKWFQYACCLDTCQGWGGFFTQPGLVV